MSDTGRAGTNATPGGAMTTGDNAMTNTKMSPEMVLLNDLINGYGDEWHNMTIGDIAAAAIERMRAWPVEERMEAMGMERASDATLRGTTLDFYFERPTHG